MADETQQRWVEGALLNVLGIGETMPGGRDELFAALRTFFERIAEKGTTVLLFEDLQWADSGLLDFIDHLLDWTKSLPIFVLTLSRPELIERRPEWGSGRRNFVSLSLEPLSDTAMNDLLDGLVPGLPEPVKKTIVSRADGIPLYAVETVRMLVAQGKLREQDGVYRAAGDIDTIAIPETLTALIAARLDGLSPDEKSVLQAAAVLGQSFSVEALEALSGTSAADLAPMLVGFTQTRSPLARGGSTLTGARPVLVRAGADPRGRLQPAGAERAKAAPPRGGALVRESRRRRAGGCPGRALRGGAQARARRRGSGRPRRPGAHRVARRGR